VTDVVYNGLSSDSVNESRLAFRLSRLSIVHGGSRSAISRQSHAQ
jgi:hypothetical protein